MNSEQAAEFANQLAMEEARSSHFTTLRGLGAIAGIFLVVMAVRAYRRGSRKAALAFGGSAILLCALVLQFWGWRGQLMY
jgi:hypothetical protein